MDVLSASDGRWNRWLRFCPTRFLGQGVCKVCQGKNASNCYQPKLLSLHMSVASGKPCLSHLESLEFQGCVVLSFGFGTMSNDLWEIPNLMVMGAMGNGIGTFAVLCCLPISGVGENTSRLDVPALSCHSHQQSLSTSNNCYQIYHILLVEFQVEHESHSLSLLCQLGGTITYQSRAWSCLIKATSENELTPVSNVENGTVPTHYVTSKGRKPLTTSLLQKH